MSLPVSAYLCLIARNRPIYKIVFQLNAVACVFAEVVVSPFDVAHSIWNM